MPTKIIRDPLHIVALSRLLQERKLPLTESVTENIPPGVDPGIPAAAVMPGSTSGKGEMAW